MTAPEPTTLHIIVRRDRTYQVAVPQAVEAEGDEAVQAFLDAAAFEQDAQREADEAAAVEAMPTTPATPAGPPTALTRPEA